MGLWKTNLELRSIAQVAIKHLMYQSDALFPMLFYIGLNPLSHLIKNTAYGYQLKNGATIMGAIKLCAKNEQQINSLIHTSRIYSNYNKCDKMVTNMGKKEPVFKMKMSQLLRDF